MTREKLFYKFSTIDTATSILDDKAVIKLFYFISSMVQRRIQNYM